MRDGDGGRYNNVAIGCAIEFEVFFKLRDGDCGRSNNVAIGCPWEIAHCDKFVRLHLLTLPPPPYISINSPTNVKLLP